MIGPIWLLRKWRSGVGGQIDIRSEVSAVVAPDAATARGFSPDEAVFWLRFHMNPVVTFPYEAGGYCPDEAVFWLRFHMNPVVTFPYESRGYVFM